MNNKLISVLTGTSIIATLGMLSVSTGANAATFTDSKTTPTLPIIDVDPNVPPVNEYSFELDSFDPSLGTLTSIVITNSATSVANVSIFNGTNTTQTFTNATATVPVDVIGPSGTFTTTPTTSIPSGTLQPSPPPNVFAGTPVTETNSFNVPASDFNLYISNSGVPVDFTFEVNQGTYSGNSVTGVFFGGDAESSGEVSITYTYNAPDIAVTPEPTSLLGLGLIGGLGLLVKRKK